MKLNMFRIAALALAAAAFVVPTTAVAEGWFKDLDDVKEVSLAELLAKPRDYVDVPVQLTVYFHEIGRSYNPYYTRFTEEMYGNFSAWPMDARLYEKRDFQRSYPLFFIERTNKLWKKMRDAKRVTPIRVTGFVRDVFRGQPWIEIVEWKSTGGGLSEDDVRHVVAGDAYFLAGRFADAAKHYDDATSGGHPAAIQADIHRRLGDALYHAGEFEDALDAYRDALEAAPASEVLRRNVAICAELVDREDNPEDYQGKPAPGPVAGRTEQVQTNPTTVDAIIKTFEDPAKVEADVERDRLALERRAAGQPAEAVEPVSGTKTETAEDATEQGVDGETPEGDATEVVEPAAGAEADASGDAAGEETVEEPSQPEQGTEEAGEGAGEEGVESVEEGCVADGEETVEEACSEGCAEGCTEGCATEEACSEGCAEGCATEEACSEGCAEGCTTEGDSEEGCAEGCATEGCATEEACGEGCATEEACAEGCASDEACSEGCATGEEGDAEAGATEAGVEDATEGEEAGEGVDSDNAPAIEIPAVPAVPATPDVVTPDGSADEAGSTEEAAEDTVQNEEQHEVNADHPRAVLVRGRRIAAPRLPFFGCDGVTLRQVQSLLEEIARTGADDDAGE